MAPVVPKVVPVVSKSGTSGANAVKFMLLSCCNMAAMLPLVPEILPRTMYCVFFAGTTGIIFSSSAKRRL
jgi:hypothetical protein